jgi:hypothetical protein
MTERKSRSMYARIVSTNRQSCTSSTYLNQGSATEWYDLENWTHKKSTWLNGDVLE